MDAIVTGRMMLDEWARLAAEAGLDGLDVSALMVRDHTPVGLTAARRALSSTGLPVVMITTYPDFCHPDADQRKREQAYFARDIALTAELGARYLRIVAGQAHPGLDQATAIGWVLDAFSSAAATAREFGVQLVYENHSTPGAWHHSDFSHPTPVFLAIADALRATDIRINFDTANTLAFGDDPLPVLDQVIGQVETVHAADTATRGHLTPVRLGTGLVPLEAILSRLKQHGFDGWISIEEASGTGREAVHAAVNRIRGLWSHG